MVVSLIFGSLLLLMAFAFHQLRRDILHPAVVFPFVWGVTIIIIGLMESFGYIQISLGAFSIFLLGNIFFVAGTFFSEKRFISEDRLSKYNLDFKKIIWFCIALHAVMLPLTWIEVSQITGGADGIFASAYLLRAASVSGEEKVGGLVGNYLLIGLFFVPVLMIGWMQKNVNGLMLVVLSLPWVFLNIFVGGRSGLITLVLASMYIYISLKGNISVKVITGFGVAIISVLVAGNLLVGKIEAGIEDGFLAIIQQSTKGFFDYLLQGPILFSEYYKNQNLIDPTWDALIFSCHLLDKLNLCVPPPLHQEFMIFSSNGDVGNVYSVFFSIYPKYGWLGVVLIACAYGFWANFHHARRDRSLFHLVMGGFIFYAILLSVFLDAFGPSIYFFVKIFLISTVASFAFKKT